MQKPILLRRIGFMRLRDLFPNIRLTKRRKRHIHQFEMLHSKGNTNYCYTKQNTKNKMGQGNPDTSENGPQDIK